MRPLIVTPAARYELIEAQGWYENEAPGLGSRFVNEVDAVIFRMRVDPRQFPTVHEDVRRALLRRFPYALMFVIEPDEALTVIACFHSSRDPICWQSRA